MDGVINVRCEAGLLNCIALLYTNNAIREKFITIFKEGKHKLYVLLFVGQHKWSVCHLGVYMVQIDTLCWSSVLVSP